MNKIEFGDNRTTMKKWIAEGVKVQTCVYKSLQDKRIAQMSLQLV